MKNSLSKVFMWMCVGLLITFLTAYTISLNTDMLANIYNTGVYWIIALVEIILAGFLGIRIRKMKGSTATCLYLFYTFLTGLSLSFIFVAYELTSIIWIFLVTSLVFAVFAFIGKKTKIDLSKFGVYLTMALLAILLVNLVNIFILNKTLDIVICSISILIFIGFIAYDVQKIIKLQDMDIIPERNLAIIGAFSLFLDFINIFLDLLNLFGNSKD